MQKIPVHHINLNDPDFIENPYPVLSELRTEKPVFYDPVYNKVFFTRHADISALMKDKRLGRSVLHRYNREEIGLTQPDPRTAPFRRFQDNVFMDMEGPSHTRLRGLVSKVFTPLQVESMRGKIEQTMIALLDNINHDQVFNFVEKVAEPLPVKMIADLLGIPDEIQPMLRPWSAAIVRMYEMAPTEEEIASANQAADIFIDTIMQIAIDRKKYPKDDLISALAEVNQDGDRLSEIELASTCIFLLNAGHEATVNGSSLGLLSLLRDQKALQDFKSILNDRNDEESLKKAVNELLRYDTPLPMFERYVLDDMDFGDYSLKCGQKLALLYISGNRDNSRFANPDQLDLTRQDNPLLTFGMGSHYCLGAPLARLELQIVYKNLFQRMPDLQLVGSPVFSDGFVIRGLKELPVQNLP